MSTSYTLYEVSGTEVSIDEHSNKLDLVIHKNGGTETVYDIEPVEMLKLLLKGITVTSYWMEDDAFQRVFQQLDKYTQTLLKEALL